MCYNVEKKTLKKFKTTEMLRKNYFIVNPKAGGGKCVDELCGRIKKVCEERFADYDIYVTRSVGDATDFVRSVCADTSGTQKRFFACGGDGTLCEVANGAIGARGAEIGLIPVGTGNDFARNFCHKELFFDIGAQLDGNCETVDILRYNDRYSVDMINIGFDCEVVKKKEKLQRKKYLPSKLAYIFGLVITLAKKPGMRARVFIDGEEIEENDFLLSTFGNGSFCGGGFNSNPFASLRDGLIDSLFVRNISRTKFVSLVKSYKEGTHINKKTEKLLFTRKASSVLLKFPSTQSISVDGEVVDCAELLVECVRGGMSFVVPKGSRIIKAEDAEPALAGGAV